MKLSVKNMNDISVFGLGMDIGEIYIVINSEQKQFIQLCLVEKSRLFPVIKNPVEFKTSSIIYHVNK